MRRLAVMSVLLTSAAAAVAFAVAVAPGCGPSGLAKVYDAYDKRAESILVSEAPVWMRLVTLIQDQGNSETPDPERLKAVVAGESVPFYDKMKGDVAAAAPSVPELATAHGTLVKFAEKRAEFAHRVAGALDVLSRGDPWRDLDAKDSALQAAMIDYARRVEGRVAPPDERFSLIQTAEKDFQRLCVMPLGAGHITAAQMGEIVKTRIQPKIREARGTSFEDDEEGRSLRAALAAADEFFDAVTKSGALMEASARLKRDLDALDLECTELYTKFREEMKAVRGRM